VSECAASLRCKILDMMRDSRPRTAWPLLASTTKTKLYSSERVGAPVRRAKLGVVIM
jgi:hypothetical protein